MFSTLLGWQGCGVRLEEYQGQKDFQPEELENFLTILTSG